MTCPTFTQLCFNFQRDSTTLSCAKTKKCLEMMPNMVPNQPISRFPAFAQLAYNSFLHERVTEGICQTQDGATSQTTARCRRGMLPDDVCGGAHLRWRRRERQGGRQEGSRRGGCGRERLTYAKKCGGHAVRIAWSIEAAKVHTDGVAQSNR